MYKKSLQQPSAKFTPNLFVNLSGIAYDPRAAYVESVCAILNESRFGPGRATELVADFSERPELEKAVFYDLSDNGEMVPCYTMSPEGRFGHQAVEAGYRRAKQIGLVPMAPDEQVAAILFPPAHGVGFGRGSP